MSTDLQGLFMDKMPARIQQVVRDENLRFMKNKAIYDADYFHFLLNIAKSSMVNSQVENIPIITYK